MRDGCLLLLGGSAATCSCSSGPNLAVCVLHSSLHCNNLAELPEELGCATGLDWMSLNCNNLKRLPESIGRLTKIVRLSVVRCSTSSISVTRDHA